MTFRSTLVRATTLAAAALSLSLSVAAPSRAAVHYLFNFLDYPPAGFSYTASDFVTVDTSVPAAGLEFCDLLVSTCTQVDFHISSVGFVSGPDDVADLFGISVPGSTSFHYFANGAFGAVGVYDSLFLDDHARLTVTQDAPGGIPEPDTWGLMLLGFGAAGAALRARTRRATT